jgi:hypothetical protein
VALYTVTLSFSLFYLRSLDYYPLVSRCSYFFCQDVCIGQYRKWFLKQSKYTLVDPWRGRFVRFECSLRPEGLVDVIFIIITVPLETDVKLRSTVPCNKVYEKR